MKRKQLTPQEKKLLAYTKDTRNTYGESRSRSRFSIARNRALGHQRLRHAQKQILTDLIKLQSEDFDSVKNTERVIRVRNWRKCADTPLGEFITILLRNRYKRGINDKFEVSEIIATAERLSKKNWRYDRWGITKRYFKDAILPNIKRK